MDIIVDKLSKSFEGKAVLSNLSLRFPQKRISAIMGPSGCGKTTLLRILLHLVLPDSGSVKGIDLSYVAAVFQEDRLLEEVDAITNIQAVCKGVTKEEIKEECKKLDLLDYENKPISSFSGGMKRRVAILRALLKKDTDLIVMDEPFFGLDEALKLKVLPYVKEKTKDKTVILVTHDKEDCKLLDAECFTLKKINIEGN